MKIRNSLALVSLAMFPLASLNAADGEGQRPGVARILERNGIVGNAALDRKLGRSEERSEQSDSASGAEAAVMAFPEAAVEAPTTQVERGPEVAGLIVRFSDELAAERAADNQAPPD